jgi:hypothetical protein
MDCYEAMEFDVTQSTQDEEQRLFTIKTNMPIPMFVYGDTFQWAKYDHHILPSNLDLISHNKAGLHQTFRNSLIQFLCTDLDGNLGFTLNPLAASKLDHFLSTLFEEVSNTANQGKMFDLWNDKSKHCLIDEIVDIAVFVTQISLSIFTNLIHKRFENHSMLESMLEILQQFYIQMVTETEDFLLFPGDLSLYNVKNCHKQIKYVQLMFCEAVKVNMTNSKETSFSNTISSTFSLITVLFKDLFQAINIHKEFCGEKEIPKSSIILLNKTNKCDGYDFNIDIINIDEYNTLQKELLMLFESYCIFGSHEFYKSLICILVEVNKTMYLKL